MTYEKVKHFFIFFYKKESDIFTAGFSVVKCVNMWYSGTKGDDFDGRETEL